MAGVKETLDVLALVDAVAAAVKAALEDHKIDFRDALRAETRAVLPAAQEAVAGAQSIPLELADLDASEVAQIAAAAFKAGKAILDAVKLAA